MDWPPLWPIVKLGSRPKIQISAIIDRRISTTSAKGQGEGRPNKMEDLTGSQGKSLRRRIFYRSADSQNQFSLHQTQTLEELYTLATDRADHVRPIARFHTLV